MLSFASISELPVSAFLPRNLWPACTQSASSLIGTSADRDSEILTSHAGVSNIETSAALSSSLKVTSC